MEEERENFRSAAVVALEKIIERTGRHADVLHYFVAHPEQNLVEASPLQGFTPDLHQAARVYNRIASLPKSIPELLGNNEFVIASRMATQPYTVFPIEINGLKQALDLFDPFCSCIWSANDDIATTVDTVIKSRPEPILHGSPSGGANSIKSIDITRDVIKQHVLRLLEYRRSEHGDEVEKLIVALTKNVDFRVVDSDLPRFGHLITTPNETALDAVGVGLQRKERLMGIDNEPYFDALRPIVFSMMHARSSTYSEDRDIAWSAGYELILTSPSISKQVRLILKRFGRELDAEKRRQVRFVLRQMIGRTTYPFVGPESEAGGIRDDPHVQALTMINLKDLEVYTAALSIRASSNFVPVIRLPTAVNNVHGELIQLEKTARAEGPTPRRREKLSRIAKTISEKLVDGIPDWILDAIRASPRIKLIADAPLEWMNVDGFPLALKAEVSRIPTTPGNLFFWHSVVVATANLTMADFEDILVIRTLDKKDPLRHILSKSIEIMSTGFEGTTNVHFVDVRNESDFIDAFDRFSGALAIFDGHGSHSSSEDTGMLSLPEGSLNAWELRKRVNLPPIIVLGACDTHPMSASHATTANGFLAAGAKTVVATSLPIDARSSSVFIARLLLRINQLLPIHFAKSDLPYRWSTLVSGMQKRQYMTDVVYALAATLGLEVNGELLLKCSLESGARIDSGQRDWMEALIEVLAKASSKSDTFITELMQTQTYLTDSLIHVQLGNPDRIFIHKS